MKMLSIIFILFLTMENVNAQEATKFGLNCEYYDSTFNYLISPQNKKTVDVIQNFGINFLRFPGGTYERIYFWDRVDLIPDAAKLYSGFLATHVNENTDTEKNDRKITYYSKKGDNTSPPLLGDSLFPDFLNFCKKESIVPIVQLNCWYYHTDKNVFSIINDDLNTVDNSKWNSVLENIKKQVEFAHRYINQVYWEIGNEDQHYFTPTLYANISAKYAALIKSLYPDDKVIITYANPKSNKVAGDWNTNMINCLDKAKSTKYIDFVAPHYYKDYEFVVENQSDLQKMIKRTDIYKSSELLLDPIKNFPNIKLFYTEFGVFKKAVHPNFNTQAHAMLMLSYLMNFNAAPKVYGTIMHTFTTKATAFLFTATTFANLNYGFTPTDFSANNFFTYIPPQAKAEKLFLENNPVKAESLIYNNDYVYTISKTSDKVIINILFYSGKDINLDINAIAKYNNPSKVNVKMYKFDDINSHQWNNRADIYQLSANNPLIKFNTNAYAVITIQK